VGRRLLDTNTCIALLNGTSAEVIDRFRRSAPASLVVCSVVRAELAFGARKSRRTAETLANVERFLAPLTSVPFDDRAADQYGVIRAELERGRDADRWQRPADRGDRAGPRSHGRDPEPLGVRADRGPAGGVLARGLT
jgi:predicted nucleic acid-binding protein